jgi:hypothetical protein
MNPSERIDKEIADHPDWRGQTMAEIRPAKAEPAAPNLLTRAAPRRTSGRCSKSRQRSLQI